MQRIAFALATTLIITTIITRAPAQETVVEDLNQAMPGSLDEDLFQDVGGLDDGVTDDPTDDSTSDLDRQLLDDLKGGEDIGEPASDDPLRRISHRMKQVQLLLARARPTMQTQRLQKEIISEIDALLEQARQNSKKGSSDTKASAGREKSGTSPGQSAAKTVSKPQDSQRRLDKGTVAEFDQGGRKELLDRAWGHLPPKMQEQLKSTGFEEFLPKYEKQIEAYFRRLAEER